KNKFSESSYHFIELGNEAFSNQKYKEAQNYYTKAIEINPNIAHVYNNRGLTHHFRGKFELAVQDFSKAIELDENDYRSFYNRGNAYKDLQKFTKALEDYD